MTAAPVEPVRIILFISKESAVYDFTRRQVELAFAGIAGSSGAKLEIVDIAEKPELAEEYNVEALPTLIVGSKRFVGSPTPEALADYLSSLGTIVQRK